MSLADLLQIGGGVLGGSAGAEGLRWLFGRGPEKVDAAHEFMRMALEMREKYAELTKGFDAQAQQISELRAKVSTLTGQLATQDGLLRESLHLIDELLDPSKPTPRMSPALKAALEELVGT